MDRIVRTHTVPVRERRQQWPVFPHKKVWKSSPFYESTNAPSLKGIPKFLKGIKTGVPPSARPTAGRIQYLLERGNFPIPLESGESCAKQRKRRPWVDTTKKVLEKLVSSRFDEAIRIAGDLSPKQFSFRAGSSTVDAIIQVLDEIYQTEVHRPPPRRMVLRVNASSQKCL